MALQTRSASCRTAVRVPLSLLLLRTPHQERGLQLVWRPELLPNRSEAACLEKHVGFSCRHLASCRQYLVVTHRLAHAYLRAPVVHKTTRPAPHTIPKPTPTES